MEPSKEYIFGKHQMLKKNLSLPAMMFMHVMKKVTTLWL
jgi:hypothetical protein